MNIVVPIVGGGTVVNKGVRRPRYLIDVGGKPLFLRAVEGTLKYDRIYFVVKPSDYEKYPISDYINYHTTKYGRPRVVLASRSVKGPLDAVLCAHSYIDNDDPLLILDPDHIADCDFGALKVFANDNNSTGVVGVTKNIMSGTSTFYASLLGNTNDVSSCDINYITSDYSSKCVPVAGIYYWQYGFQFIHYAKHMIRKGHSYEGRFHLAPAFNEAVMDNHKLNAFVVKQSWFIQRSSHVKTFLKMTDDLREK
tara:strand:+ start:71 stop:826 length:756 start_codon:yes stop_codon:yes gene_type:complete